MDLKNCIIIEELKFSYTQDVTLSLIPLSTCDLFMCTYKNISYFALKSCHTLSHCKYVFLWYAHAAFG